MKQSTIILMMAIAAFFFSCNDNPNNQQVKNVVPQLITDTLQSDNYESKLVIIYAPSLGNDYEAEHESGVSDTSIYAIERGVNNGQIHFPCTNEERHDYEISKDKIINIISIKYDMVVYDKTDYIFTHDSIFEIHISTANGGIFTNSDIKTIPKQIDFINENKSPLDTSLQGDAGECHFNNYLFNLVLNFCQKNKIETYNNH